MYHPSLEQTGVANVTKKRKFISKNSCGDRELDSHTDGSKKASEEISTFLISHEYVRVPLINKVKSGRRIRRSKEDENTKNYTSYNDNLRTTADTGGENLIRGLEFKNLNEIKEKGGLQKFIEMLKLIEKRQAIKVIDIIIDNVPEGKKFSKLRDEITRRRYAIGKITMSGGRESCLIEVEREDKALSMLLLKSNNLVNWKRFCSTLIIGLVNASGRWSTNMLTEIQKQLVVCYRKKHTITNIYERVNKIYENLI